MFQLKTDPMIIRLLKQGLESGVSGLGITFTTRNSFEMLCQFVLQLKKSLAIYTDNPVIKKGIKFYKEILMKQVSKSSSANSQSFVNTSFKMDTSIRNTRVHPFQEQKINSSLYTDTKTEEQKFDTSVMETGPRLFHREIDPDESLKDLSASRIVPVTERSDNKHTPVRSTINRPTIEENESPDMPMSKEKKKKSKSKKGKSSGKKAMINSLVVNKAH